MEVQYRNRLKDMDSKLKSLKSKVGWWLSGGEGHGVCMLAGTGHWS
jgi:hypothetical protein